MAPWRRGPVTTIDPPAIMFDFERNIFPKHEISLRPFGAFSVHPSLQSFQPLLDTPDSSNVSVIHRRNNLCLAEPLFVAFHAFEPTNGLFHTLKIPGASYTISIAQTSTLGLNPDSVLRTVSKPVLDHRSISSDAETSFSTAKREKIDLLLKCAVALIPLPDIPVHVKLQPQKCVLTIKTQSSDAHGKRHRARIVSARKNP